MNADDPTVTPGNEVPKQSSDESRGEAKARREQSEKPISQPGGFKNDPPDPTNPNEAIERHRRKLRP